MDVVEKSNDGAVLRLTRADLTAVNNALNEVLHGPEAIGDWEFHTRIGVHRVEAERVLRGIADALDRASRIA